MASDDTSIRVSRSTLEEIARFQRALGTDSIDQTLRAVFGMQKGEVLSALFGSARGRLKPFKEADRLDADH